MCIAPYTENVKNLNSPKYLYARVICSPEIPPNFPRKFLPRNCHRLKELEILPKRRSKTSQNPQHLYTEIPSFLPLLFSYSSANGSSKPQRVLSSYFSCALYLARSKQHNLLTPPSLAFRAPRARLEDMIRAAPPAASRLIFPLYVHTQYATTTSYSSIFPRS